MSLEAGDSAIYETQRIKILKIYGGIVIIEGLSEAPLTVDAVYASHENGTHWVYMSDLTPISPLVLLAEQAE